MTQKSKNLIKDVCLYIVCILIMVLSVTAVVKTYSQKKAASTTETTTTEYNTSSAYYIVDPTADEPFHFWDGIEVSEEATTVVEEAELPDAHTLELDCIYQNPELPSGCEAVALTMVLNYYGFSLDKTDIADDYLIYSDDNFVMGFKGNPYKTGGGGAYAPSMTNTANRFFIEQQSELRAINISGLELEELYPFIAGNTPVMVWSTIDLKEPKPTGATYRYGDFEYRWVTNEHCVVLTGYDLTTNQLTIYDSLSGVVTCDIEDFKLIYDKMWKMAVIVQ